MLQRRVQWTLVKSLAKNKVEKQSGETTKDEENDTTVFWVPGIQP